MNTCIKFRTKYDFRKVSKRFEKPSLTDQQYKDECTIDGIIRRYGVIPPSKVVPLSADVSDFGDFASCMSRVNDALAQFDAMPSEIRARFGNDPKAFFEFVLNPANIDEAVRLGLREVVSPEVDAVDVLKEISDKISSPTSSAT